MADEKLNTGQGEQIAQEETPPIEPTVAEAAAPGEGAKEPEAPTPGEEVKEPETSTTEKALEDLGAEQKGPRRGRPPKDKNGPEAGKSPKGRTAKDKSDPAKGKAQRDKVSQGKKGKTAPEQSADKGGSGPAVPPVAEQPAEPTPPPRPVEEQKIVYLKLSELHPFHTFREHPFKVVDDSPRMQELVSSIKAQGVFTPATVRPEKDGNGYEIIAGHCRMRGSELAGLEELPCIVRDMDDHEAVQEMKNSNKQRGDPLPSELARLLDLEVEDIKHQGGRLKGVAEGDIGKRSVEIVGEEHGMNYKKVMRYIRLNFLVPELLDMADAKKIGFMPAVELSYIRPKNQRFIAVSTRSAIGNSAAMMLMLVVMLPAFLLAMYEHDGLPLEKVVRNIVRAKFLRRGRRLYRTENIYAPFAGKEEPIAENKSTKARPRKG